MRVLLLALTLGGGAAQAQAVMEASLVAGTPGPAPVGTMITWAAQVSGAATEDLVYRFRVRGPRGGFRVIRDYGPRSTLDWTSIDEGVYELELSVRKRGSLETVTTTSAYRLQSRATGARPVISPTSHPLVFLFSSPGCKTGQARVQFQSAGSLAQYTPYKPCVHGSSLNFTIAGLAPATSYSASLAVNTGRESAVGPAVTFMTGDLPPALSPPSVVRAPAPSPEGVLLQFALFQPALATDLDGTVLWFGPSDVFYCTNLEAGGTFFGFSQAGTGPGDQVVRRFDLAWMTVQETSVARVNEQLVAMEKRPITGFHHEARLLADGRVLLLASVEQILLAVQGSGPVDVLGDMILVLDEDLQVAWAWDTFDHLDISRRAVGGETCVAVPGCAPYSLAPDANDWTHGNSVRLTPDGNLLYSSRHQDWLIKIAYRDGAGDGAVIWRLGKDGDFTYDSTDSYPWFSHQHDADYEPGSGSTITLFDNGNTRNALDPLATSRGQAIELDEERRTARLVLNADLGLYSSALGSAQKLRDGTYHFDAGFVNDPDGLLGAAGFSIQTAPSGEILSSLKLLRPVYRSYRVGDLYGSPLAPSRPEAPLVDFRE